MKILQISDIHWTKRKQWNDDFPGMKNRFLVDIKEYIEAENEIDYVFICGDIAYKGAAGEYNEALEYIDKICDIIGKTREDVFVVPGNHDLNRKADGCHNREILNVALAFAPKNENFLENILKSNRLRKDMYAAFTDYNAFANQFFCQERLMNKCIKGTENDIIEDSDEMYYQEKLKKKVGDISVVIRGVNTALNCDESDWNEEHEEGHKQMLPRRAYVMEKEEKQEVRIIMAHHPLPFLTFCDEEYLDSHYHIQLFGHVHLQQIEGENFVRVQSGAFDPPKDGKTNKNKYLPVYNIIEITQKDATHVVVKGSSQIWDKNKFVKNENGCFVKEITIERNVNKWRAPKMEDQEIDARSVKFKYMKLDDRTSYFDKIPGVSFTPNADTEYDNCIEFLSMLEKMGKLEKLNEIMR